MPRRLTVVYREAGEPAKPSLPLPHGFPAASDMFRGLIRAVPARRSAAS